MSASLSLLAKSNRKLLEDTLHNDICRFDAWRSSRSHDVTKYRKFILPAAAMPRRDSKRSVIRGRGRFWIVKPTRLMRRHDFLLFDPQLFIILRGV